MYLNEAGSPDSGYRSSSNDETEAKQVNSSISHTQDTKAQEPDTAPVEDDVRTSRNNPDKEVSDKLNVCDETHEKSTRKRRNVKQTTTTDEENTSPVLGIRILPAEQFNKDNTHRNDEKTKSTNGSDDTVSLAAITEDSSKFTCRLCCASYSDCLSLARHKCARMVNVKYECSECGKVFGCPANLASHKRWHKPQEMNRKCQTSKNNKRKKVTNDDVTEGLSPFVNLKAVKEKHEASVSPSSPLSTTSEASPKFDIEPGNYDSRIKAIYPCPGCKRRFRRQSNRRKHALIKHGLDLGGSPARSRTAKPQNANGSKQAGNRTNAHRSLDAQPSSCSLSTLALAAESLNNGESSEDYNPSAQQSSFSPKTDSCEPRHNEESDYPLDLRVRAPASTSNIAHSVAKITNKGKSSKKYDTSYTVHGSFIAYPVPELVYPNSPMAPHAFAGYQNVQPVGQVLNSAYAPNPMGWPMPMYPYGDDALSVLNMSHLLASIHYRM
ncbi:uncharacterized protein LOC100178955 [Ciona intestinalis]